jgi:hypothetical protein
MKPLTAKYIRDVLRRCGRVFLRDPFKSLIPPFLISFQDSVANWLLTFCVRSWEAFKPQAPSCLRSYSVSPTYGRPTDWATLDADRGPSPALRRRSRNFEAPAGHRYGYSLKPGSQERHRQPTGRPSSGLPRTVIQTARIIQAHLAWSGRDWFFLCRLWIPPQSPPKPRSCIHQRGGRYHPARLGAGAPEASITASAQLRQASPPVFATHLGETARPIPWPSHHGRHAIARRRWHDNLLVA